MIKKLAVLVISLSLIMTLIPTSTSSTILNPAIHRQEGEGIHLLRVQDTEKEGKEDTYYIALLRQIREKVDAWLKSLNEKIEREDITRFKVRFYEILRNILEWFKEKLDAKIESSEEQRPEKRDKEGLLRETHQRVSPHFEIG
jgi:hypothetical protein